MKYKSDVDTNFLKVGDVPIGSVVVIRSKYNPQINVKNYLLVTALFYIPNTGTYSELPDLPKRPVTCINLYNGRPCSLKQDELVVVIESA